MVESTQVSPLESIFGEKPLWNSKLEDVKVNAEPKFIGIYFGAHWAPPCRRFTKKLTEVYNTLNSEKKAFEVIFVSSDGNLDHFKANLAPMPWTAVQYEEKATKDKLTQKYGVVQIPSLIILDEQGNTISTDGDKDLKKAVEELLPTWKKAQTQIKA